MDLKQEEMIKNLREGRVAVAEMNEMTTEDVLNRKIVIEQKPENAALDKIQKAIERKRAEVKNEIALPQVSTKQKVQEIQKPEQIKTEEKVQSEVIKFIEQNKAFEDNETETKPKAKPKKFRIKLFIAIIGIVILIMTSLCIFNSIEISNLQNLIEQSQTQYQVNLEKYIYKINNIEELSDQEYIEGNANDLSPIPDVNRLIGTPAPISEPNSITVKTNWFNNIVDRFLKFFGISS